MKEIIKKKVKSKMVGKTTPYDLFKEGRADTDIEIFSVDSIQTVELLNEYININLDPFYLKDNRTFFTEDMIGYEIFLAWNYEKDFCNILGTLEEIVEHIKSEYESILQKKILENAEKLNKQ